MDLDGWHPDPYGRHDERFFERGEPTPLVRDGGVGSYDEPPASFISATAAPPTQTPTLTPTPTSETPPGAAGPPPSGPMSGHLPVARHWWFWATAFALVAIIIAAAVVVFGGNQSANDGTGRSTAFCVKAPHNAPCPDSYLRSQEALLHDFWEAYLTDSTRVTRSTARGTRPNSLLPRPRLRGSGFLRFRGVERRHRRQRP